MALSESEPIQPQPSVIVSNGMMNFQNSMTTTSTTTSITPTLVDVLLNSPLNSQWQHGIISIHNNDTLKLVLTDAQTTNLANDCQPIPPESIMNQAKRFANIVLIIFHFHFIQNNAS